MNSILWVVWWWRGAALVGRVALVVTTMLLLCEDSAWAHVFVSRSEPQRGATLDAPPAQIRIWFDGSIELVVRNDSRENSNQHRVDQGDGRVSSRDNRLLEVGLPLLTPGHYRVFWSTVARDGHRREGEFAFMIK